MMKVDELHRLLAFLHLSGLIHMTAWCPGLEHLVIACVDLHDNMLANHKSGIYGVGGGGGGG